MKIYVDWQFLENLFLAKETERHYLVKQLLSRANPEAEVIINIDVEDAYADPEKQIIIRQIARNLPLTDSSFLIDCQSVDFHRSGTLKLFFVDSISLEITERFGCFAVSTTKLEEADWLFYTEPFRIDHKQRDWSILKKIKHPCNAIVITDNYLLVNDKTLENTLSILSQLMPDTLTDGFTFHLTIIGYSAKDNSNIKAQAKEILEALRRIFLYNISLSIIRADHHGRYIHTNYYRIISEKGFGLFQRERIRPDDETSVECQPLTIRGRYASVLATRSEELRKCVAINRTERMSDKFDGNRINRLLN